MDDLLKQARALGEAIAGHPVADAMNAARQQVLGDKGAQDLITEHTRLVETIAQKRREQKPIEPSEKQRLAEVEASMAGNAAFKTLMRAQTDYIDLMNRIHKAIEEPLLPADGGEGGS